MMFASCRRASGSLAPIVLAAAFGLGGLGCDPADGDREFTLRFAAELAGQPFACGQSFANIGTSKATVSPLDFRVYIHDVALVRGDGSRVALEVPDDGQWQRDGVILLDFEDGSGTCMTGSPETNLMVKGRAPADDYVGVEFTLGLPSDLNHLDGATAPAPLNAQGLWWSWQGGYKYMRLDLRPATQTEFFYHLGASGCSGSIQDGFACTYNNSSQISLDNFDPQRDEIVVDGGQIFANVDVEKKPDDVDDMLPGCMSSATDPECPAMMGPLGLSFDSAAQPPTQTVFSVRTQ